MKQVSTRTSTYTGTFTKPRINVLSDHFELFLRCGNMSDSEVNLLLKAVERKELQAVGIYLEENSFRIAEVEFEVDWREHMELTHISGELFDTDLPGWKDGVAPEAYVAAGRLTKAAKSRGLKVRSWIRVAEQIRSKPDLHKRVCDKLGYSFGGSVAPWRVPPNENRRKIEGLSEAKITTREA